MGGTTKGGKIQISWDRGGLKGPLRGVTGVSLRGEKCVRNKSLYLI